MMSTDRLFHDPDRCLTASDSYVMDPRFDLQKVVSVEVIGDIAVACVVLEYGADYVEQYRYELEERGDGGLIIVSRQVMVPDETTGLDAWEDAYV